MEGQYLCPWSALITSPRLHLPHLGCLRLVSRSSAWPTQLSPRGLLVPIPTRLGMYMWNCVHTVCLDGLQTPTHHHLHDVDPLLQACETRRSSYERMG